MHILFTVLFFAGPFNPTNIFDSFRSKSCFKYYFTFSPRFPRGFLFNFCLIQYSIYTLCVFTFNECKQYWASPVIIIIKSGKKTWIRHTNPFVRERADAFLKTLMISLPDVESFKRRPLSRHRVLHSKASRVLHCAFNSSPTHNAAYRHARRMLSICENFQNARPNVVRILCVWPVRGCRESVHGCLKIMIFLFSCRVTVEKQHKL